MSLDMLHVESARSRLPMICSAISLAVLVAFTIVCVVSWLIETNKNPQSTQPIMNVRDAEPPDPYATESWVRHGREF